MVVFHALFGGIQSLQLDNVQTVSAVLCFVGFNIDDKHIASFHSAESLPTICSPPACLWHSKVRDS